MKKFILSILIILQLFCTGCIQKKEIEASKEKNCLTYSLEDIPKSLLNSKDNNRSQDLLCALFDGLLVLNADNEVSEGLAASYDVSKDGIQYTFKLREDIKWSNEKPIVASDFVEFFKNLLDPKNENPYVSELYCIYGAKAFNKGEKTFKDVAIDAPDNNTLNIRLNNANPEFLKILTKPAYRLRKDFEKLKDITNNFNNIEYTGAYVISKIDENEEIQLKKNDNYWDKVLEDEIKLVINSPEKALASFNSGKIDLMFNLPLKESKINEEAGKLQFTPNKDMYALIFNYEKKDLGGNPKFRYVMNEITKFLYKEEDMYSKAGLIEAKGNMTFRYEEDNTTKVNSKETEDVDVSKINSLLKEMDFNKDKIVTFISLNDNKSKLILENIEKILKEDLEIRINKKYFTEEDYNKVLKNGNFDIALNIYKNSSDKMEFLKMWTKDSGNNLCKYNNSDYDKILNKIISSNQEESSILSAVSILSNDIAYIPVYYDSLSYAVNKSINDIELDGNNNLIFKSLSKSR